MFSPVQAIAAAEAGAYLISPFVGRILDWYRKKTGAEYEGADDPGVKSVTDIYHYMKKYGYRTVVMGASFRNIGEIQHLAGCDLLTISPKLLEELDASEGPLPRMLSPETAKTSSIGRIAMNQDIFERMHRDNAMACDQLRQGIEGFTSALVGLEKLLANRLSHIGENNNPAIATR